MAIRYPVSDLIGEIVCEHESVIELRERLDELVTQFEPSDAFVVYGEARAYARARLDDVRNNDLSVIKIYDVLLGTLEPWLARHGFPRPCPVDGFATIG